MEVRAVIIASGDELIRGERLETNGRFLARELFRAGFLLVRTVVVGDAFDALKEEFARACADADFVVLSGGLGPTDDDLTRDAVAAALGVATPVDAEAAAQVRASLGRRGRPYDDLQARQARLPEGCALVRNADGTAPGFRGRAGRALFVALPGVPSELETMWRGEVRDTLGRSFPSCAAPAWKVLRCFGLGEAEVQRRVAAVCPEARPGEIGMCAEAWIISVFLAHQYAGRSDAIRGALEPYVFGEDDDSLARVLVRELGKAGRRCAVAESATGGGVGYALTGVPGSSEVFAGGAIVYSDAEKAALGVDLEILRVHGAVSAQTAAALAGAVRRRCGTSLGLAVTGYAGPSGGTAEDPVGTVYVAAATEAAARGRRVVVRGGREQVRQVAINHALSLGIESVRAEV